MHQKIISFFVVLSLSLVACQQNPSKQTAGIVLWGIAGSLHIVNN